MTSAQHWLENDEQLQQYDSAKAAEYLALASEESLNATVEALKAKNYAVHVAETAEEALAQLTGILPEGCQFYNAGSTTLEQIGFTEWAKGAENYDNIKNRMFAEQDPAKQEEIRKESLTTEYWISSVPALTETGDIITCCLTGTRTSGFTSAQNVVVVTSTSKIVADLAAARQRMEEFCLPVESARVRVAYGVPASSIQFTTELRGPNPMSPVNRVTVILIKEQLGF